MSTDKNTPNGGEENGAMVAFSYDRLRVERFRKAFPRARWNDDLKAWFLPGKTAKQRFNRWLAQEDSHTPIHADGKGRDAFAFEPIESKYLRGLKDHLEVSTPYSRTVVEQMQQVPFASWQPDRRVWSVPYQSFEALRRRWEQIEKAAKRNEPDERKRRREADRDSEQAHAARARALERRRRRYPLDPEQLPPLGRPIMTSQWGVVVFTECDDDPVDPEILRTRYANLEMAGAVWGRWRLATLDELVKTWPSRPRSTGDNPVWRQATIDELRAARKAARKRTQKDRH